jgi:hypothetical protein
MQLMNPIKLLLQSLDEQAVSAVPSGRYLLIIDTSTNDAVLRFLMNILSKKRAAACKLLKLGDFVDDIETQRIHLISHVRWAAEKGEFVVLSHTDSVNESFYDLFNQHFRKFEDRTRPDVVEVVYHANIAIGAHSRKCKVSPGFQCMVHLTLDELQVAPAPFLNRFEKYRLTMEDALNYVLLTHPFLSTVPIMKQVILRVFEHMQAFVRTIGSSSIYGFAKQQTIESAILYLILRFESWENVAVSIACNLQDSDFVDQASLLYSSLEETLDVLSLMQLLESPSNARERRDF